MINIRLKWILFLFVSLLYVLAIVVARIYEYTYTLSYGGITLYSGHTLRFLVSGLPGLQYALLMNQHTSLFLIGLAVLFILVVISP